MFNGSVNNLTNEDIGGLIRFLTLLIVKESIYKLRNMQRMVESVFWSSLYLKADPKKLGRQGLLNGLNERNVQTLRLNVQSRTVLRKGEEL
ncbi:hypothetical protein AVEN_27248-1 [Araneus ventricosus]|uniref:Uncharacterized protein n=1 Tax=Araneus ventricosus TaxID=182803 RepID=A0A4Y2CAD0_ARAVE|nr:hypothetical protein AVEN_27248-1 [Araneus ventricosus]